MNFHAGSSGRIRAALASRTQRNASGQALVEFVFVLPLLLMLLVGIIQVGILLNNWVILTDAVRSGARQLSVARTPPPHPSPTPCDKARARILSAAIGLTTGSIIFPDPLVAWSNPATSTCTNMAAGGDATVSAEYPCNLSLLGIDYAPNCRLRAWSTVRIE